MRSSSELGRYGNGQWQRAQMQRTRGLNLTRKHHPKAIPEGAATTLNAQYPDEPLNPARQHWLAAGTTTNLAKVSLVRKIATIALVDGRPERNSILARTQKVRHRSSSTA